MHTRMLLGQPDLPVSTPCVAAIDLGTNSFRMTIAALSEDKLKPIVKSSEAVGLGRCLGGQPIQLSFKGMKRAWRCLERFKQTLQAYSVTEVRIVGTSALRQANNAVQWLQTAQEILGHPIEIISGDEEGRLVYKVLREQLSVPLGSPHWMIDIGGGSTEVVQGGAKGVKQIYSLNIGCVVLQKKYPLHWAMSEKGYLSLVKYCLAELVKKIPSQKRACPAWITKGLAPTVMKVSHAYGWGDKLDCALIEKVHHQLCQQRFQLKGLDKQKRQNFPYGLAMMQALMIHLNLPEICVTELALEDALLMSLLHSDSAKFTLPIGSVAG